MSARPTLLLFHALPAVVEAELEARFAVSRRESDADPDADELVAAAGRFDAFVPTVTDVVPAPVFGVGGRRVGIVANFGVGVERIDVEAARRHGVVVTNTPGVLTECTADLTIALILMVLRRLSVGQRLLRAGAWSGWRPTGLLGRRVSGRTLGIVGMGRIGQAVARRARDGFGMRVLYHSRTRWPAEREREAGVAWRSLDALLAEAEIVSLHCPLTADTAGLLDARRLARLRPDAVLINTARGGLVDEPALIAALSSGRLAGAGLDVFAREPEVPAELLELDSVVALPHLGSATEETRVAMGRRVVANLEAYFAGAAPPDRVA